MAVRLSDRLLTSGLAPVDVVHAAIQRQAVYGGALDTALLELEALDEDAIWSALAQATDLPVPDRALCEAPEKFQPAPGAALELDAAWSERCRAVPVGLKDGALQLLCGEPVARGELAAASALLGIPFKLFAAPEIWVAAVQEAVFGRPMAPRLVRLFARVVGAHPVRRWQASHAPPPLPEPPVPEFERIAARPPGAPAPAMAVGASAPAAASMARVATAPDGAAPSPQVFDKAEVPALIARLDGGGEARASAHAALIAVTRQDFGEKPKRWSAWWEKHQDDDRIEWLFDGLLHKTAEIRAAAETELRALTGQYFGYHFDLPKAERESARQRWQVWWNENRPRTR